MATKVTIGHTVPIEGKPTISKENENFFRLEFLLIETGRKSLQYIFQKRFIGSLENFLQQNEKKLKDLYKKKIINSTQWSLMFPTAKVTQWDISLLCMLLTSVCCLSPPKKGWKEMPYTTDLSISADIVRLRCYRNECQGHISKAALTDAEFNVLWGDIETVILRLSNNTLKNEVDNITVKSFETSLYQKLLEITNHWVEQEFMLYIDYFKEYVDNLREVSITNREQIKLVENTLSKFEGHVTKQLIKIQNNNCTIAEMSEKVRNICNETLGSIVRIISSKERYHEELLMHLQNITLNLDTVQTSLEMQKDIAALQMKTIKTLEDQGNVVQLNHSLAKSGDRKLDCLIKQVNLLKSLCSGGCHGDLSEDEESKDHTFDEESTKYQEGPRTPHKDLIYTCRCGYKYRINALRKHCEALVENGESNLFCLNCKEPWEYTEIRDNARWSDQDREAVERKLNQNFIERNKDIKNCPSCERFCVRKNPRDVRIVCLFCSLGTKKFEFCWQCLKEWNSNGISSCGNIGCTSCFLHKTERIQL